MKPFRLNRRTVLRGLATGLALPPLDAMINDQGRFYGVAQAQAQKPPVRFFGMFIQNGTPEQWWNPKKPGQDKPAQHEAKSGGGGTWFDPAVVGEAYDLNVAQKPLEPYKADFNLITGLHQRIVKVFFEHADGNWGCFTGIPMIANAAKDRAVSGGGPTLEWVLGNALGKATKFPALSISLPRNGRNQRENPTYSWMGVRQPAPTQDTPRKLADLLMPAMPDASPTPDPAIAIERRRKKSILDYVRQDARALEKKLGAADKVRLDQHFTSITEIERQLTLAEMPRQACGAPPETPTGAPPNDVCMPLMAKLVAYAFRCDLTRYVLMDVGKVDPLPGKDSDHDHGCSHEASNPDNIYYINKKLEYFAHVLKELKAWKEGEQTLLYNSLVLNGLDVAQGWRHNFDNLPLVLAGNAGGQVKTGRHLYYRDTTWNNLNAAVLRYAGMSNVEKFGADGTGILPRLGG